MADAKSQTSLQRVASATKKFEEEREVRGKEQVAVVNGGDRSDMVKVRLKRRFQDLVRMHEVGTVLTIPRDLAPKSAKMLTAQKEPEAAKEPPKEPAKAAEPPKEPAAPAPTPKAS